MKPYIVLTPRPIDFRIYDSLFGLIVSSRSDWERITICDVPWHAIPDIHVEQVEDLICISFLCDPNVTADDFELHPLPSRATPTDQQFAVLRILGSKQFVVRSGAGAPWKQIPAR